MRLDMTAPDIAKTAAYAALTIMAMVLSWTGLMLGRHLAYSLGKVDAALTTVNAPCGNGGTCGTLADVAKALNTIRGTAGQVEIAADHENRQLGKIDAQEAQLYSDVHGAMLNVQEMTASFTETSLQAADDLKTMNQVISGAQPVLDASALAIGHADATLKHVDALVEDPSITRFLDASADTSLQVDGTATDVRKVADKVSNDFLNPAPKHWWNYAGKVWQLAWQGAMLAK
jgi:hypothetical protein